MRRLCASTAFLILASGCIESQETKKKPMTTAKSPPKIVAVDIPEAEQKKAAKKIDEFAHTKAVTVDNIKIQISTAFISKVRMKNAFDAGATFTKNEHLHVRIKISNAKKDFVLRYSPWQYEHAVIRDEFDNAYARWRQPIGVAIDGQPGPDTRIDPGKFTEDTMIFELPLKSANTLRLEMDCAAIQKDAVFAFTIARSFFDQVDPSKD